MAITHSYVDYGAGSDATGDGTIGTPWKTLQKAFDTLTRNTTDGNQVNLKAGTAHVNAAALDLTTFIAGGALSATAPLIIRGYTSAANDGGIGEIDCGGATMWAGSYSYLFLVDLELHTFGDAHGIVGNQRCYFFACKIHKGASTPSGKYLLTPGVSSVVRGCYLYAPGAGASRCISGADYGEIVGNYVDVGADSTGYGIYALSYVPIVGNIVKCANTAQVGIYARDLNVTLANICYNSAAGTNQGVYTGQSCTVANNIICGWSGVGGEGIFHSYAGTNAYFPGYNAFWNNTTPYTIGDMKFIDLTANDVSLAADPFTDAANGDFSLTAAAKTALAAKGWPTSYLGAHANTVPNLNIGPIQMAAGGAAGGGFPILGGSVVR